MAEVIRMPRMSDTMEEGNIVGWLVKVGESVEPGDVLAEVETDKATMELESYHEGTLLYIGIESGPVLVNSIIAIIGEKGEDFKELLKDDTPPSAAAEDKSTAPVAHAESTSSSNGSVSAAPSEVATAATVSSSGDDRIKASPLAKKLAVEKGVNLSAVSGSGEGGRIIKRDIESFVNNPTSAPSQAQAPAVQAKKENKQALAFQPFEQGATDKADETIPVSQMRKVIARRLGESKFSAPHFYLTIAVDMEQAMSARKSLNEISPTRISYNDLVVKACAFALKQHPAINSSWLGDSIRQNGNINIGVAVAVTDGLLVPVIKHADKKSLSQINAEVRELAGKAKDKKLQPDQMQGNTFTISNLGMFDIEEFTAIINPPDACILAVGSIVEKAVVKDGQVVPGHRMRMTLSCDHRVVDGATGAQFLKTVKAVLEDPVRMLV